MEEDVLDYENPDPRIERFYYKRSSRLLKYTLATFILSFILLIYSNTSERIGELTVIPILLLVLGTITMSSLGVVMSVKSYLNKERYLYKRVWVLITHLLILGFYVSAILASFMSIYSFMNPT